MRHWLWILGIVCWPGFALGGWTGCPGSASDTSTRAGTPPGGGDPICYRYTAITSDPPRVYVGHCARAEIHQDSDVAQTGVATDGEIQVYTCPGPGTGVADCEKVLVDTTGDGIVDDVTLNGSVTASRDAIYDLPRGWIAIDATTDPAGTAETRVTCHGG